jgi:hypothetical protein
MVPDNDPILPVTLPEYPGGASLAPPAKVIDRIVFAFDGRGDLPRGDYHLFTLDAEAGGTPMQVTDPGHSYNNSHPPGLGSPPEISWSRDGSKLYFVAMLDSLSESERELELDESDIYSLDLNSGDIEKLTDREGPDRGVHVSPNGEWIAYTGFDTQEYADASLSNLYLPLQPLPHGQSRGPKATTRRRLAEFPRGHNLGSGQYGRLLSHVRARCIERVLRVSLG